MLIFYVLLDFWRVNSTVSCFNQERSDCAVFSKRLRIQNRRSDRGARSSVPSMSQNKTEWRGSHERLSLDGNPQRCSRSSRTRYKQKCGLFRRYEFLIYRTSCNFMFPFSSFVAVCRTSHFCFAVCVFHRKLVRDRLHFDVVFRKSARMLSQVEESGKGKQ